MCDKYVIHYWCFTYFVDHWALLITGKYVDHWALQLMLQYYQHKQLIIVTMAILLHCQHDNEERYKRVERYKTAEGKRKRVQRKIDRAEEQKLRYFHLPHNSHVPFFLFRH